MVVNYWKIFVALSFCIFCDTQEYDGEDYKNVDTFYDSENSDVIVYNVSHKHKPDRVEANLHPVLLNNEISTRRYPKVRTVSSTQSTTQTDDCRDKHYKNLEVKDDERRCKGTLVNYPFSASIQRLGSHYASGALVDKRWILTAAEEFYNVRESIKLFRARLGSVNCKKGGVVVPIKQVEIHPYYIFRKPNYNLAMIRLGVLVDFTDFIRPIGFSKVKDKVFNEKLLTTYWPRLIVKGKVLSSTAKERIKHNSMRVSAQRIIPWDKCFSILQREHEVLAESSLCLKPIISHHSNCMPDAGAPVVAKDGLWGITSSWVSKECSLNSNPTIVTRISAPHVRSWLDLLMLSEKH